MKAILWAPPALIALLLVAGLLYQRIGGLLDRRRLLSRGRLLDTGDGRALYLVEKGQGSPTVVFEAGFAATSLNWTHIQSAVSNHVHTVSYDRYGLGWSSACTTERAPSRIASELRHMLAIAGIEPPYVLVGHSFGGLVMRRYALDYPEETVGLVLIDPMRTGEWPPVAETHRSKLDLAMRLTPHAARLARFGVMRLGARSLLRRADRTPRWVARLTGSWGRYVADRLITEVGKMPAELRPEVAAHWSTAQFYRGVIAHLDGVVPTVNEMHDAAPLHGIPVVVLTPGGAEPIPDEDMRKLGDQSEHIVAAHSEHWVHLDEPQLVIETILAMIARNKSPSRVAIAIPSS